MFLTVTEKLVQVNCYKYRNILNASAKLGCIAFRAFPVEWPTVISISTRAVAIATVYLTALQIVAEWRKTNLSLRNAHVHQYLRGGGWSSKYIFLFSRPFSFPPSFCESYVRAWLPAANCVTPYLKLPVPISRSIWSEESQDIQISPLLEKKAKRKKENP